MRTIFPTSDAEADKLANRLGRIWAVTSGAVHSWDEEERFIFHAQIQHDHNPKERAEVSFDIEAGQQFCLLRSMCRSYYLVIGRDNHVEGPQYRLSKARSDAQEIYAKTWTDIFRRNCWLSGFSIESTGTEWAAWMDYGKSLGMTEEDFLP